MANPARGEVALQAGEKTYILDLSFNALCEIEEHFGATITEVAARLQDPAKVSAKTIRGLVWAALQEHQPGTSEKDAGRVITEAGTPAVMEAIGKAFKATFPDADGAVNPPKAGA